MCTANLFNNIYKFLGLICKHIICFSGTGEVFIAKSSCDVIFRVEGLQANNKYMFAVAAYDSNGQLIGGNIGKSTMPIIASFPESALSTYYHFAQVIRINHDLFK